MQQITQYQQQQLNPHPYYNHTHNQNQNQNHTHNQNHNHNHNQNQTQNQTQKNQVLKRTASRAELDKNQLNHFIHSELPPPLPTPPQTNSLPTTQSSAQEDQIFVKPEYLTPYLPNQPLPSQPSNHHTNLPLPRSHSSSSTAPAESPGSCDSELRQSNLSRPRSIIHPTNQAPTKDSSLSRNHSIKKRRFTITDEPLLPIKPRNSHVPLNTPSNQSSSSPDTRINKLPPNSKHSSESFTEPICPLVMGYTHQSHHNPSTMQQVAQTMKLRDEQKRLIEQRRNSFAGHSSLNSFSFSSSNPNNPTHPPPPSPQPGRYSPHTVRSRNSISKPVPPGNTGAHQYSNTDVLKLLTHQKSTNSSSPHQQPSYLPPPPVVNLPSIDEAAALAKRQNSFSSHHQARSTQNGQSHHPNSTSTPDTTLGTDSPPPHDSQPPQSALDSTLASRRGDVVREKVKHLALAPQAFRPQLLVQQSVKSAPIRSGFLQATAPNGEVLKTPLIARTNLAASSSTPNGVQNYESQRGFPNKLNSSHPNSNFNHTSRLNHSTDPVPPNTAHPNLGEGGNSHGKGLERRMTMHGALIQVPTLSHLLINSNSSQSQSTPNRGRPSKSVNPNGVRQLHQSFQMPGPVSSIPPYPANATRHPPPLANVPLSQNHQPASLQHHHPFQNSPPDTFHPPTSARPRPSIGSAGPTQIPGIPPKHMFLQLFDTFYDSLTDSKILQSNLEEQIRRSSQLLTLLQQSSNVFEKMLDDRMSNMQKEYTRDLQILENRIERLEASASHPDHDHESSNDLSINRLDNHHHFSNDDGDDDLDPDEDEDVKNLDLLAGVISPRNDSSKQLESNVNGRMKTQTNHQTSQETTRISPNSATPLGGGGGVEERTTRINNRLEKIENVTITVVETNTKKDHHQDMLEGPNVSSNRPVSLHSSS